MTVRDAWSSRAGNGNMAGAWSAFHVKHVAVSFRFS